MAQIICGVDVSSTWLDASIGREGPVAHFANSPEGIEALSGFCRKHDVTLVAMEATGGYEKRPFGLLWAHGLPAAIANPRAVRCFAEAMGLLEKTDRIDAGVIAWYAEAKRLKAVKPAGEAQAHVAALVTRLRQLTDLKTAQSNQRRLVTDSTVMETFEEIQALLARQIRSLEAQIAERISEDPLWRELDKEFRTIKGVAGRTVARLMAEFPEIGIPTNKAAGKLTGTAPMARDSGKRNGKRSVRGGRAGVRSILFVVAECVRRYDPDFAEFHKRLSAEGKAKKVIRMALAHKLTTRLNAKARDVRKRLACAT